MDRLVVGSFLARNPIRFEKLGHPTREWLTAAELRKKDFRK
jgi:hypothetical protein